MSENDNNNPNLHEWIEPELEARIVAWVLGEASPFEAAELERLVAAKPELAIFKRRIESVHRLAAEAAQPDKPRRRMSPERRAKLLEALGKKESVALSSRPAVVQRRWPKWVNEKLLAAVAACFVIGGVALYVLNLQLHQRGYMTLTEYRSDGTFSNPHYSISGISDGDDGGRPSRPASPIIRPQTEITSPQSGALFSLETTPADLASAADLKNNQPEADQSNLLSSNRLVSSRTPEVSFERKAESAALPAADQPLGDRLLSLHTELRVENESVAGAATGETANFALAYGGEKVEPAKPNEFEGFIYYGSTIRTPTDADGARLAGGNTYTGNTSVNSGELGVDINAPNVIDVPIFKGLADNNKKLDIGAGDLEGVTEGLKQEAAQGQDLMSADEVTIKNGELAKVKVVREFRYPTEFEAPQIAEDFSGKTQGPESSVTSSSSEKMGRDLIATGERQGVFSVKDDVKNKLTVQTEAKPEGIGDGPASEDTQQKLKEVVLPSVNLNNMPVSQALTYIQEQSKKMDPENRGVDIVNSVSETRPHALSGPADSPQASLDESRITLNLKDVSVGEAVNYIAELGSLKSEVVNGRVVVSPQGAIAEVLVTKRFRIPQGPLKLGESLANLSTEDARRKLETAGVSFPEGANMVIGGEVLIVRNTEGNLNLVQALLEPDPAGKTKSEETKARVEPFSTFSLHVSDVSFRVAQTALAKAEMPDPAGIRAEEFYNAVDYGDPGPAVKEEVACRIEQSAHPVLQQRNLVRIAMKVAAAGRGAGQPLRLTILLDTSGSMERLDRAASVRKAMETLASLLGPKDLVTVVGFARQPRLLADRMPGDQAGKLPELLARTPAEGGTNLEEALKLAMEAAQKQFDASAQNRVVLLTDGAANLGDANPSQLAARISSLRQAGIAFDACGVGAEGYNDELLEALTRKGDGRYYYLKQPEDADSGFARQLAGAFRPAAENIKLQVRFNPARVGSYRLIGFEKHQLKKEDFRNDKVDAAELAAEEAAVALYQVQVLPEGEGELGEVFVRFRDAASGQMVERSWTMPYEAETPAFDRASGSMQLAGIAAMLAEKLAGSSVGHQVDLAALAPMVNTVRGQFREDKRVQELVQMYDQLRKMEPSK